MNFWVRLEEIFDRVALVGREVVGDYMDFFAARLVDHDVGQEGDELGGRVALSGLAQYLAGLGIEGGVERQGAVTKVFKAMPLGPAWESGNTGSLRSKA